MATFLHYIGGKYTPAKFIAESKRVGFITRRASANQVKTMNFKDTVLCLQHRGKNIPPAVFAEFVITGIVFEGELNAKLIQELKDEDKIIEDNTGAPAVSVERECGEFLMGGGATLRDDVEIPELMEKAERIQSDLQTQKGIGKGDGGTVWCMVMGILTKEYLPARTLTPSVPFTRGFMALPDGTTFADRNADTVTDASAVTPSVAGVQNYERAWANE